MGKLLPLSNFGYQQLGPGFHEFWAYSKETASSFLSANNQNKVPTQFRLDGRWGYDINSLGYRGPEPVCDEPLLLACGDSYTFGLGVKWEQTWPRRLCNLLGYDWNLANIGCCGVGNDFITRMVLTQLQYIRPQLVVCLLTYPIRRDSYHSHRSFPRNCGKWAIDNNVGHCGKIKEIFNPHWGALTTLSTINLLSNYLGYLNIPYLIAIATNHKEIYEFRSIMEQNVVACMMPDGPLDLARDNSHPGPRTHLKLAETLYERHCDIKPEQSVWKQLVSKAKGMFFGKQEEDSNIYPVW